jgi:hypothetical protein
MACANRFGWPGYRWGRGPDWTTTGMTRPVTEIKRSVSVPVDDLTSEWADQVFVDPALADQPARRAARLGASVVDLAGRKPAMRHCEHRAMAGGLVGELRPDRAHCGIGHRPAKRPPTHTAFHGLQIKVFDHDVAIAACQLSGELMGGFPTQVHAPAVQPGQLGFRCRWPRDPGMRRESSRPARRRAVNVALSGAGFGYSTTVSAPVSVSTVATVAKVRIPRSIPARTVGRVTVGEMAGVRSA